MARSNVDQLNFELILDDKNFNKQVKAALDTARSLNTELSNLLNIKRQYNAVSQQDVANNRRAQQIQTDNVRAEQKQQREVERTLSLKRQLAEKEKQITDHRKQQLGITSQLASAAAAYFSVAGAERFLKKLVQVTGEFEMQRITLEKILGDKMGADNIFSQIKELAVQSPFTFKELATYAKQLSAYSIPMAELFDTTKMLADVSAGLGVDMNRIVLAYGQIRSASFLRGQEVRQMTEAGIPILTELAKQFEAVEGRAISAGQVFDKISRRQVPFEMVAKVFRDMTSEGGKFYQMQEIQSETLKGRIMKLKDAIDIAFADLGEKNKGMLVGTTDALLGLVRNFDKLGRILVDVAAAWGAFQVAMHADAIANAFRKIGAAVKAYNAAMSLKGMKGAGMGINVNVSRLNAAANALGVSVKSLKAGLVALGATAAVVLVQMIRQAGELDRNLKSIAGTKFKEAETSAKEFERLFEQLSNCVEGSDAYREAIGRLNNKYGEYLPQLLKETASLEEVKKATQGVTEAIYARARAYAYEEGIKKIDEKYSKKEVSAIAGILSNFSEIGISKTEAKAFLSNLSGAIADAANEGKDYLTLAKEVARAFFGEKFTQAMDDMISEQYYNFGSYINAMRKSAEKKGEFGDFMDVMFSGANSSPQTSAEYQFVTRVENAFKVIKDAMRGVKVEADILNQALTDIGYSSLDQLKGKVDVVRLQKLIGYYEEIGRTDMVKKYKEQLAELTKTADGWRAIASGFFNEANRDLKPGDTDDMLDYFERLRKEYKNLGNEVKDQTAAYDALVKNKKTDARITDEEIASTKKYLDDLKARKKGIEDVGKYFGVSVNDKVPGGHKGESSVEKGIKLEIKTYEDLYRWYKKLQQEGVSESTIKAMLVAVFPDQAEIIQTGKFREELERLLDTLGKFEGGKAEADRIRESLGIDQISELMTAKKTLDDFMKEWQKWQNKDFNLEGKGIAFDLSKIVSDLNTKNADADSDIEELKKKFLAAKNNEKLLEQVRKEYGEEAWKAYAEAGDAVFKELVDKEKEYNTKIAQDKVDALAEAYVKEKLFEGNIDLTDWGDKSFAQIEAIRSRLKDLMDDNDVLEIIPDDIKQKATEAGISLDDLAQKVRKIFTTKYSDVTVESMKKLLESARKVSSTVGELGDALGELGDALDSQWLSSFSSALGIVDELAQSILSCEPLVNALAEGMKNTGNAAEDAKEGTEGVEDAAKDAAKGVGDLAKAVATGDIISLVVSLLSKLVTVFAKAISESREMKNNIAMAAIEMAKLRFESELAMGTSTIFGEDSFRGITNAATKIAELNGVLEADRRAADESMRSLNAWHDVATTLAFLPGLSAGGILALSLGAGKDEINLADVAKQLGESLYDEYGNLNANVLEKTLELYPKLDDASKQWLTNAKNHTEEYRQAMEQLESTIESTLGGIAGDIVDDMLKSFLEIGDAAADITDSITEWSTELAKAAVQSIIVQTLTDDLKDEVMEAYKKIADSSTDAEEKADIISSLADKIEESAYSATEFANAIFSALRDSGLLAGDATSSGSLGSGIKEITEDTANLLASYINAIRADVSYSKTLLQKIVENTGTMNVPNLSDYLMQIQANTYNSAMYTQNILSRIDSMMGLGSEGSAIKVITT